MTLYLNKAHFPVNALGPGRRIGLWFQGCSIRCPGCISRDTWDSGTGATTVDGVMSAIAPWLAEADGVTISGGEPFDQPSALAHLLEAIAASFARDVLVFSGYVFSQLTQDYGPLLASGWIDALVSGPFLAAASQTQPLRGSDNQELHLLTKRGQVVFQPDHLETCPRLDVFLHGDGLWFAGIPKPADWPRLQRLLDTAGVSASFSHSPTN